MPYTMLGLTNCPLLSLREQKEMTRHTKQRLFSHNKGTSKEVLENLGVEICHLWGMGGNAQEDFLKELMLGLVRIFEGTE